MAGKEDGSSILTQTVAQPIVVSEHVNNISALKKNSLYIQTELFCCQLERNAQSKSMPSRLLPMLSSKMSTKMSKKSESFSTDTPWQMSSL